MAIAGGKVSLAAVPVRLPAKAGVEFDWRIASQLAIVVLWLAVAAVGLCRLAIQWTELRRIRRRAIAIVDAGLLQEAERLRTRFGIRSSVTLLASPRAQVPLAAGIVRPFILLPTHPGAGEAASAMLAHELAHIASRDALWNLLLQVVCRLFFFQPLNGMVRNSIRCEMDFQADFMAVHVLGEQASLVHCLYSTGRRLSGQRTSPSQAFALASGMALFQSALGQRIEAILNTEPGTKGPRSLTRAALFLMTLFCVIFVALIAPRAVSEAALSSHPILSDRNPMLQRTIAPLLVLAGMNVAVTAEEPKTPAAGSQTQAAVLKTTPDELPEGIRRFNGMLVGRVAAKDVEQGTFTVLVDAVPRVWENSRAEDPRSIVGKTVKVSGVFGKFLDVLVVVRIGETLEFECKYDGDGLVFPGELLRKVAPYDPADYPVLPEAFRGFQGQVAAEILQKDPETFELIIRVDRVLKTWEGNSAREPRAIEGKTLMLAGFWNRRDAYHDLKVGDRIDAGMRHIGPRSDHLSVAQDVRKIASRRDDTRDKEEPRPTRRDGSPDDGVRRERQEQRDPLPGFRGMLVGRLIEKDIERGTFTITVDAVPRVWENNRSANPKALIGRNVTAEGVNGRLIDALVVAKVGDTVEFGALHDEGPRIRVGEILQKVAAVQPGDYPVLPDGFRGFRGMVTARVVRKTDELSELIVEVEEISQVFAGNRAEQPDSIIGKQAILAGFWNRKDDFHAIRAGDRIRCGMHHTQVLSDHLVVIESVSKLDRAAERP
ncbi:MAG: M56 family metallopeptidase [Pirellulaceae bacterium]|nr:M56 family metallopeptidase [Pirellulaceae bacterium]